MKEKVFLRGSSLVCTIGDSKEQIINQIREIDNSNYKDYLLDIYDNRLFYKFKNQYNSNHDKLFSVLNKIVQDAITNANLTDEEKSDMHIFIGSTSMSIALIEEYFNTNKELLAIDYGSVSEYIEKLANSKHKCTLIQSACTASANAFAMAAQQIQNKFIKRALVIGIEIYNDVTYKGFESLLLLSPSGEYKPFDKSSDGLILGEGCSAIILDTIPNQINQIRYISSSNGFDGYSDTGANPDGVVTYECMKQALQNSNLTLKDITCIKAHATGTYTSNISEATAIQNLFNFYGSYTDVVSLKPYIGHTLGACGTNEIVLFCEAISQNFIPKTLGFKEHYDDISFSPLTHNKTIKTGKFLFNFIGFGGTNTSIILSLDN